MSNRSSLYYQGKGEDEYSLKVMHLIDEAYTKCPYLGVIKLTKWLQENGYPVNEKRVRRLARQMGIMAVYPKRH